jgi:uncharacterized protein (TIGR00251 family)
MLAIRAWLGGCEFDVQVTPRAAKERLGPVVGERLKVALTAPPVDDAANEALRALVAETLGVSRQKVAIARGQTSRKKTLRVAGVTPEEARARLPAE